MATQEQKKSQIILQPSHIKTFKFIKKYIDKNMFSPLLDEVGKGAGVSGRQAYNLINELIELGYLGKSAHKKRGIIVIKELV